MLLTQIAAVLPYAEFDLTFWALGGFVLALVLALPLERLLDDPDPPAPKNGYDL